MNSGSKGTETPNDDLTREFGSHRDGPEVITQYGERLKEYEDIITVDFIKEIYLKNPALRPDAIKNVDFDTVKEQIMEEVFATVKLMLTRLKSKSKPKSTQPRQ